MQNVPTITESEQSAEAERWVIVVRDDGRFEAPIGRRVARLLKSMLRGYGLRCVSVGSATMAEELARCRAERDALAVEVERLRRKKATR